MVDLHDSIGRLRGQLQPVDILDLIPLIARWLREIYCHCDPPAVMIAVSGFSCLSYRPYSSLNMQPLGNPQ